MWYIVLAAARIVKGPDNVGAQVDSRVQLKCMFHHRSCRGIMWTKVEQSGRPVILYGANTVPDKYRGKYRVSTSAHGDCILHINTLQLSDAGIFTCVEGIVSKSASLTVIGMYCIIFSALLSISIASGALMVWACRLDHLSICLSVGPESVLWQNG